MVLAAYISFMLLFSRTAAHLLPIGNSRLCCCPTPTLVVKPVLCLHPSVHPHCLRPSVTSFKSLVLSSRLLASIPSVH